MLDSGFDAAMVSSDIDTRELMSQAKFYEGYARWNDNKNRYETWEEAVERVMDMHRTYYKDKMSPKLSSMIAEAETLYKEKYFLGAQRALQFGGEQLLKNPMRLYNCTSSYCDRAEYFGEYFWILLSGCGAGFSAQKHHIAKLPKIQNRNKTAKIHVIEDSIEGWATAADVLLSSYFVGGGKHPEFERHRVFFDTTKIRPKNALISGGFKAPGPEPLRKALDRIEHLLQGLILKGEDRLRPIHAYDICMHLADAVLSGGVRRAATICLFSLDDMEMMQAKTGNWYIENPQRARSNNSAVLVRNEATFEQFQYIMNFVKEFGEPGFVFTESTEHCFNPCVEISMAPFLEKDGERLSGWQGCNLTEINGAKAINKEEFFKGVRGAAIMGTLQAGYTNFHFVTDITRGIFEREALLGVSVTGWMNNPDVLLNEDVLKEAAQYVLEINKEVAKLIGINPTARATCVKPAGNASVILQTSSGIHGEHAPKYIRNVQMNKDSEVAQLIKAINPYMVEESVWSAGKTDYVISFPILAPKQSIFRKDLYGTNLLEKVKKVQGTWIEYGTNTDRCVDPTLRHNVSNTVSVLPHQWEEVTKYLFENRHSFTGVSLLGASGDRDYNQAPNTEVLDEAEIVAKYGRAALFAAGLVVDVYKGFDNLWEGCMIAQMDNDSGDKEKTDLRAEWIRRFRKFADSYFHGDLKKTEYCLKDVHLLHKWTKIQSNMKDIDFVNNLSEKVYIEIDTMGSAACVGGACEI